MSAAAFFRSAPCQRTGGEPSCSYAPSPQRASHRRSAARPRPALRARASAGGLSYKDAGVDIDAGNELVRRIQKLNPNIGGFSGMVPFGDSFLVAGTDGVGTKLKLAFDVGKHDTVGIDLVAMSVNDIITSGAKPMFFLDYFATGKLDVDTAEQVIKGIVEGCRQSDCTLMGGETAEMPGFYSPGEYDLAGFAVGSVLQSRVIDGKRIAAGDAVLALPSSGVHSNGFSLVRKVLEVSGTGLGDAAPWSDDSVGHSLLTPTTIYVRDVLRLTEAVDVKGLVHMTGGGFPENIPRVVPKGLATRVSRGSWEVPALFQWLQEAGKVADEEMFRTFNMGVGMVIVVAPKDVDAVLQTLPQAWVMGEIVEGSGVEFTD
ncbi:PURM1 [Auxenochlorella protothecoides x Auxenochlorella symbiontica]